MAPAACAGNPWIWCILSHSRGARNGRVDRCRDFRMVPNAARRLFGNAPDLPAGQSQTVRSNIPPSPGARHKHPLATRNMIKSLLSQSGQEAFLFCHIARLRDATSAAPNLNHCQALRPCPRLVLKAQANTARLTQPGIHSQSCNGTRPCRHGSPVTVKPSLSGRHCRSGRHCLAVIVRPSLPVWPPLSDRHWSMSSMPFNWSSTACMSSGDSLIFSTSALAAVFCIMPSSDSSI